MRNISLIVLLSADSVSIICSLLTLWTIYRVNRWNGYTKLIFHLAFAQLLYDLSTLLVPIPGSLSYSIYVGYRSIFGLVTTLLTNVIAITVSYTVAKFRAFEVSKYLSTLIPLIYLPSVILGILIGVYVESDLLDVFSGIYFWLRVLSISFNIISYLYVSTILFSNSTASALSTNSIHATYQQNIRNQQVQQPLHRGGLNYTSPIPASTSSSSFHPSYPTSITPGTTTAAAVASESSSSRYDPLRAFVRRFQYYPLIQVICRCAVSWYEYVYGYSYNYHSSDPLLQQILIFFYVLFLPSLGTFYFFIYISVSPNASRLLSNDFDSLLKIITCGLYRRREGSQSRSNDKNGSGSVSGLIEGFARNSHGDGEGRSTMMSLYRHFLNERMSSFDHPGTGSSGISTPLQRFSVPQSHTSRWVSIDPSIPEMPSGYDDCDEDELTKEIQRVYEGTGGSLSPPQEISLSSST
jgi:hypothetical protein